MHLSGSTLVWILRLALLATAVTTTLLTGSSVVESVLSWALWAMLLIVVLVPSPAALLVLRAVAPANLLVVAILSTRNSAGSDHRGVLAGIAIAAAVAIVALAVSADVGRHFVQASAYGAEQRFPLRLPAALAIPLALSWLIWTALVVAIVMLTEQWLVAVILAATTILVGVLLWPRVMPFVHRWLVILPTSVVVHDAVVLAETLMLPRRTVIAAGLALADTQAFDLTGPAAGRVVELGTSDAATVVVRGTKAEPAGRAVHARAVLVAPSRPGAALRALNERSR